MRKNTKSNSERNHPLSFKEFLKTLKKEDLETLFLSPGQELIFLDSLNGYYILNNN